MLEPNFNIKEEAATDEHGTFVIEPLEQGYGHTLGNALRRVLLSSLKGAAITVIKVEGVKHQFSTLPGLKDDIVEFILNLKKIRLRIDGDEEMTLKLSKHGPGQVYAKDIELPAGVTIANPDLYLATLADKKTKLDVEMRARTGFGYETASEKQVSTLGFIPIDSLFSPVTRVNYTVKATRVGRMTNLDKLVLDIWTDGSVTPEQALQSSAKILVSYFTHLYAPKEAIAKENILESDVSDELLKMRIEELDIPTRIVNALENGGIENVEQLLNTKREDLVVIKNLGTKSLSVIAEKLKERGIEFNY